MSSLAVGVDLGGTKMALALVDAQGQTVRESRLPTQPQDGSDRLISRLAEAVRALTADVERPIAGVGVGVPGHVQDGVVLFNSNLGWRNVPLQQALMLALSLPITIENDVRALAAGEARWGHGAGCAHMVYLAVGTGLGGAAVLNGTLWTGATGFAMEIGHLAWPHNTRRCTCGKIGCIETLVSGLGVLQGVQAYRAAYPESPLTAHESITTVDVLREAQQGDALARHVLNEARDTLVQVGAWMVGLLNAEVLVIGGGMAKAAHEIWWPDLERDMQALLLPGVAGFRVYSAALSQTAVGAASLVIESGGA